MPKNRVSFTFSVETCQIIDKLFNELPNISKKFMGYVNIESKSQFIETALKREFENILKK